VRVQTHHYACDKLLSVQGQDQIQHIIYDNAKRACYGALSNTGVTDIVQVWLTLYRCDWHCTGVTDIIQVWLTLYRCLRRIRSTCWRVIVSVAYPVNPSHWQPLRSHQTSSTLPHYKSLVVIMLIIMILTRNTFCGTWYLPHSQVHNERTVPIIVVGCITHARNGRISTSAVKPDLTILFLDPDFL